MNLRARAAEGLFALLLLAAALMLAFLSTRFGWQHDFSHAQRASLDARTLQLLRELDAPVAITSYAPPDAQLRAAIADFIARYQRAKPDIALSFIDPDSDPAATREAGIQISGELLIRYRDRSERLKVLTERDFDNALLRLARARERLVAFLSGDGERKPDGVANADLGNFGALLKAQGVRAIPLNLDSGTPIPQNADLVVIADPQTPIAEPVARQLVDYIERGGNLLWLAEPGEKPGLEPLAKALSLRVLDGVAVDGAGAALGIGDPSFVAVSTYPQSSILRDFTLTTLYAQAAALAQVADARWQWTPLLRTSEKSWTETGAIPKQGEATTISYDASKGEIPGPLDIGVALTRLSPSPAKREQRVAVIGDGDFLSNAFLGNGGNREFGERVFDWLLQDDALIEIPEKSAADRQLNLSAISLGMISLLFLIVLPGALLLTGALIYWHRRRA
jgi:hypothetical protein